MLRKLLIYFVAGPLYLFDACLAKGRRAIRRISIGFLDKFLPQIEVNDTILGPSVATLASKIIGEYSTRVLDIGARWGSEKVWWRVSPIAALTGFDPDPSECETLNAKVENKNTEKYVPLALGSENRRVEIYLTRQPACSSIYEPDTALISRYPVLKEIEALKTSSVAVTPLDQWWEQERKPEVSFIKIDTQGYELEVLKGSTKTLEACLGLEVEVEFSQLYRNQPVFNQVDAYLREKGFVLWSLQDFCKYQEHDGTRSYTNRVIRFNGKEPKGAGGRLFWANAIYFRDYNELIIQPTNQRRFLLYASFFDALGDFSASSTCLESAIKCAPEKIPTDIKLLIEKKIHTFRGDFTTELSAPLSWYPNLAFRTSNL